MVLFVASSPEDQDGLRIDKEMREIQQKVRMADHRDALKFEYAVAAQPADLLQRLNEVKPDVVHFSGHSGAVGHRGQRRTHAHTQPSTPANPPNTPPPRSGTSTPRSGWSNPSTTKRRKLRWTAL
jgi:hypothetical protein